MYTTTLFRILLFCFTIASYAGLPHAQPDAFWADMLSSSNRITTNTSSTLEIHTNASSTTAIDQRIRLSCFDAQDFNPTSKANYFDAVQKILRRGDALVSRPYYLGPSPRLRWQWFGGPKGDERACRIVLGSQSPRLTDEFPLILVAHVAALIADRCVTEENGYAGGWASAGPRMGLVVVGYYREGHGREQ